MKYENWKQFFLDQEKEPYFVEMSALIEKSYSNGHVFPSKKDIFRAFELTPLKETKVVILGQDPYHQPGQANGLAFSVNPGVTLPRSLNNIYKEIENDTGYKMDYSMGDLTYLAIQGVLMFNPIFTVEKDKPLSHNYPFYTTLTKNILKALSELERPIVYILWGLKAQQWKKYITNKECLIIMTNHPSPLSANRGGFFNMHTFTKTNQYLVENNSEPIKWHNT